MNYQYRETQQALVRLMDDEALVDYCLKFRYAPKCTEFKVSLQEYYRRYWQVRGVQLTWIKTSTVHVATQTRIRDWFIKQLDEDPGSSKAGVVRLLSR